MNKIITYRGIKIEIVYNSDKGKEYQVSEYNIGRYGTLKEVYQQIDKNIIRHCPHCDTITKHSGDCPAYNYRNK